MRFARPRRQSFVAPRLPLIALIDVVMFLLLYFIMEGNLAPLETQLSAALRTEARAGAAGAALMPQIVNVEPGPRFRIGQQVAADRASLSRVLAQLPRQAGIVVRVSAAATVADAAAAIQACKDAGFAKVSYVPAR